MSANITKTANFWGGIFLQVPVVHLRILAQVKMGFLWPPATASFFVSLIKGNNCIEWPGAIMIYDNVLFQDISIALAASVNNKLFLTSLTKACILVKLFKKKM
jgi:hypothetical protein